MAFRRFMLSVLAAVMLATAWAAAPAGAQTPPAEGRESCPGLVATNRPPVTLASLRLASLAADQVRLTYAGHSTFLIESPKGVRIVTDYNDYVQPPGPPPTIITMNRAHDTHFSEYPNPAIPHVLRGWAPEGAPARHDLHVQDVHVRNVPSNIRDWGGGTQRHGNSVFVFEVGSLCVAHLGHLHHPLNKQQLEEIGRVDVVLVPVDGSFTLDLEGMMEVLKEMKAPLMLPMHYFSHHTLNRFLDRAREQTWDVEMSPLPVTVLSRAGLPATPKILVLPGR